MYLQNTMRTGLKPKSVSRGETVLRVASWSSMAPVGGGVGGPVISDIGISTIV